MCVIKCRLGLIVSMRKGTATLTVAGEEQTDTLVEIQQGQMHSLRNGGAETVVLIEQRFHVLPVNNLVKAQTLSE